MMGFDTVEELCETLRTLTTANFVRLDDVHDKVPYEIARFYFPPVDSRGAGFLVVNIQTHELSNFLAPFRNGGMFPIRDSVKSDADKLVEAIWRERDGA